MRYAGQELRFGLFLAPMAGFSDYGMRAVCREMGAEVTVTEMVSARAVVYRDKKTAALSRIYEGEEPCALQLFGGEAETLARAASLSERGAEGGIPPAAIDINMGCPVRKIYDNGEGSALMRDPEGIYRIVRAVRAAVSLPVSVKLRAGIDPSRKNAVECALAAEAGGASLVAVHGRTRSEMYGGRADREIIRRVKASLTVPVIANGDITSGEEALSMLRETGADGLMIGRGAVGNPFLFGEIRAALAGEKYFPPSAEERLETAMCQLSLSVRVKGETLAVREARGTLGQYLRAFRGAAALRARIHLAETVGDVASVFRDALCAEK